MIICLTKRRDQNEPLYHAELKMFKCSFPNCSVSSNEPLSDAELKMFKCSFPNCSVSPKQTSNLKRHMTTCHTIKKQKHSKLTCSYCKVTFSQKFNWDWHVQNIHQDTLVIVHDVTEADKNTFNDIVDFSFWRTIWKRWNNKVIHSQWMRMITHLKITMMKSWMSPLSVTLASLRTSKCLLQTRTLLFIMWKWWTV